MENMRALIEITRENVYILNVREYNSALESIKFF